MHRRQCLLCPNSCKPCSLKSAAAVFDDKESVKPSKVVQLESVDISDPVHKRPEQPSAFRIRGREGGELLLWSEASADVSGWRTFFEACAAGNVVKTIRHFRLPLETLLEEQQQRLLEAEGGEAAGAGGAKPTPLSCGVPFILLDCLAQLRALGAASTEGATQHTVTDRACVVILIRPMQCRHLPDPWRCERDRSAQSKV